MSDARWDDPREYDPRDRGDATLRSPALRDEHYDPFQCLPPSERPIEAPVFVLVRVRGDQTDSMRGLLRAGSHGWRRSTRSTVNCFARSGSRRRRWPAPTWQPIRTRSRPPAGCRSRFSRDYGVLVL